ncbi:MAG: twin transmembrane helix small protein [Chromatiales bacterium]|nr:twin transmembrane helix small protein [Chromatiales bacterium]
MPPLFRYAVLLLLLAIVASLFSGLFYIGQDQQGSRRVVNALTVRITLSVLLFLLLIGGYFAGYLQPHGLMGR